MQAQLAHYWSLYFILWVQVFIARTTIVARNTDQTAIVLLEAKLEKKFSIGRKNPLTEPWYYREHHEHTKGNIVAGEYSSASSHNRLQRLPFDTNSGPRVSLVLE
jgi:hypothetical protein